MNRSRDILPLVCGLLLVGLGALLILDRPGLRSELHPLTPDWDGSRVIVGTGEPQVRAPGDLQALVSKKIFSARWRGWLVVETGGDYRFKVDADEGGYLIIAGKKTRRKNYRVTLDPGVYEIEIGFQQTRGDYRLGTRWVPPGGKAEVLPVENLFARRPIRLRQGLRTLLSPVARPLRQVLGAALLLIGVSVFGFAAKRALRSADAECVEPRGSHRQRRIILYAGFLLALFVLTWIWSSRFTAPLFGGDDARYIFKSLFPAKAAWFFNRFVHVYLLRFFMWLRDWDGFLGARTYWSFMFSVVVTATAVGCAALGPRLQLRTTAVTLFLLIGASSLTGLAGGAFADYSTTMFVTLAVVVYLHGLKTEERRGRAGWHELAIGVLTVAACKSKATGVILGWLPLLFLWTESRFDLRGFLRKMGYWVLGVVGGLLVLMSLDAWILGDFFYCFKPDIGTMRHLHLSHELRVGRAVSGWFQLLWLPGQSEPGYARGFLWLLALAAPLVAIWKRQRIEYRLLFLMPLGYLLFLVAVYLRAPHVFSMRHLFPVIPLCCIAVGAILFWLGLEEASWKELLLPRVLLPLGIGAASVVFLINPVRLSQVEPPGVPGSGFLWLGWLLVIAAIALLLRPAARAALMLLLVLIVFGPSFEHVRQSLSHQYVAQRGELILYPWEVFRDEIVQLRPGTIAVAPELWSNYGMVGKAATRQTVARAFFHRQDLMMEQVRDRVPDADCAVTGPRTFRVWRRLAPGLERNAKTDRSGNVTLIRPRQSPE